MRNRMVCFAFDEQLEASGVGVWSMPRVRAVLGGFAGLLLALLLRWRVPELLSSCSVTALLGYFGMAWAKYIDF